MELQELIRAVIDKIRQLAENNDVANNIAKADSGIRIFAEIEDDGAPILEQLRFISKYGDLYVTLTSATYFVDDDDLYGTELCTYRNWDELLTLSNK